MKDFADHERVRRLESYKKGDQRQKVHEELIDLPYTRLSGWRGIRLFTIQTQALELIMEDWKIQNLAREAERQGRYKDSSPT